MIAGVRGAIGLPMTFLGIALGGLASLRLGARTSLLLGAILQPLAVLRLRHARLARRRLRPGPPGGCAGDAFEVIMGFNSLVIGAAGVALIAYMSSLTSLGYTATQYALLTSAMALVGQVPEGLLRRHRRGAAAPGLSLLDAYACSSCSPPRSAFPAILVCAVIPTMRTA